MSEQPGTHRPRIVRAGDVPLPGAAAETRIAGVPLPQTPPPEPELAVARERYEAPAPPPARPATPWRGLLTAACAATALGVLAGWGVHAWRSRDADTAGTTPVVSNQASARADRLVRGYLQALADGNPRTALEAGLEAPTGNTDLISQTEYAQARQNAPVAAVHVANTDPTATLIPAAYTVGGRQVRADFPVTRDESGAWRMVRTTRAVRLVGEPGQVPLLVNGRPARAGTTYELLPGEYRLDTGLPYVDYGGDAITVLDLGEASPGSHPVTPRITEAGQERIRQVVATALDTCAASNQLAPPDCPYRFAAPRAGLRTTSVRTEWERSGLQGATAVLDRRDPQVAVLSFETTISVDIRFADGSSSPSSAPQNRKNGQLTVRMPITGRDNQPMPVTWQGQ